MKRAGYSKVSYNTSDDWSVMWAHDYPFKKIKPVMMKMNSYQKVNVRKYFWVSLRNRANIEI